MIAYGRLTDGDRCGAIVDEQSLRTPRGSGEIGVTPRTSVETSLDAAGLGARATAAAARYCCDS
jgi:hypothetical protein